MNPTLDALNHRIWVRAFQARTFLKHGFLSRGSLRFADPNTGKQFMLETRECQGHWNVSWYELRGKNSKGIEKWKNVSKQLPKDLHACKDEQDLVAKINALLKKYSIDPWPMNSPAFM